MSEELTRRKPEYEEAAFDMILEGKSLDEIAQAMGLGSRRRFQKYCMKYAEFQEACDRARLAQCLYLEEQMLKVCDDYNDKYAKTQLEALAKILKYRDPKKYGEKVNLEVAVTVDISGSLNRAEQRMIDVTASNVIALNAVRSDSPERV